MPPSGVDYASGFLNGYAPEYVLVCMYYSVHLYTAFFLSRFRMASNTLK